MTISLCGPWHGRDLDLLGLVACGDDSASSSEPATLTVTASEPSEGKYAFDVPRRWRAARSS